MKNRVRDALLRRGAFIITLLLILGAVSLIRIISTHKDVEDVAEIDLPLIEILTQIETNQLEQSINFERTVRYAEEIGKTELAQQNFIHSDTTFRHLSRVVEELLAEAKVQVEESLESTQDESHLAKLKPLLLYVEKLGSDHKNYEKHALEVIELLEQRRLDEALLLTDRVEQEEDQFNQQIEGVLFRHELYTEALVKSVEQEEVLSIKWVATLTLAFVVFSLIAVYMFSYKIWRPLEDIRDGAEELGAGKLNRRVKLRSNSITEDVVESFNTMADRLQDAQKDIEKFISFSYRSSHDLKAPIENIQSLLEMLEKEKTGSSNYETILSNAKRSALKLETTVNALNEFNQVREKLGTRKEMLDFETTLKEVAGSLLARIKESGASIRKDFSACPQIFYPKPHLRSVLYQLLSNALTYRNPDRKLQIEIKTQKVDGHVILIVRDNGLGFDSVKHGDEILEPFVRIHSHTEGTGLGLHIVKTIVNYHKGAVRVESSPKKGARFTLTLN